MTDDPTAVLMILMSLSGLCCASLGALVALAGAFLYYRSPTSDDGSPKR